MPMLWKESSMKFWIAANMDATRSGSLSSEAEGLERCTSGNPPTSVRYTCSIVRCKDGQPATRLPRVERINSSEAIIGPDIAVPSFRSRRYAFHVPSQQGAAEAD